MSFIIVTTLALIIFLGTASVYYVHTQKQNEWKAVYELSSKTILWMDESLAKLTRFRSENLEEIKSDSTEELKLYINKYIQQANINVDQLMDNDLYTKAAKAVLPRKEWQVEFKNALENMESKLIDQEALIRDLQDICGRFQSKLREDLLSEIDRIELSDLGLSEKTMRVLANLQKNPSKMIRLLGEHSEIRQIAEIDLQVDAGISIITLGTGMTGLLALSFLDISTITDFIGAVLKDNFHTELAKQVGTAIMDWLIQEIGEQALMEILESFAVALTGIGILYTAYKSIKYIGIFNRFIIEKEPLQQMRRSAKSSIAESLNKIGDNVGETLHKNMDDWILEVEKNLIETRKKMENEQNIYKSNLKGFLAPANNS